MTNEIFQNPLDQKISEPLKNKGLKINESETGRTNNKTQVKIAPLNLHESCKTLNEFSQQIQLDTQFKNILKEFEISIVDAYETKGIRSILHSIDNPDGALDIILVKEKANVPNIKPESIAALVLRLVRMKLKLCIFHAIYNTTGNFSVIKNKYRELLNTMNTTYFELDFQKSKIVGIGVVSTIKLIKKHLSYFETELKSNLPGMHDLCGLHNITAYPNGIEAFPSLYNAMKNIAPKGFSLIEKDYYMSADYCWNLILKKRFLIRFKRNNGRHINMKFWTF